MTTKEWLEEIDKLTNAELDKSTFKPCCSRGCSHCCDEPLYVGIEEAEYMLEMLDDNQLERVKERTAEWTMKALPFMAMEPDSETGLIDSYAYRDAKITCPLLENNECMVYERRPMGCRSFFAAGNPDDCRMPMRRHQRIAHFRMNTPEWGMLFNRWFGERQGNIVMDHLGVLLADKFFGIKIKSTARQEY